jgi:hypothetical protein
MDLQEVRCGGTDCIKLAENMDWWWALVNAIGESFFTSCKLFSF